MDLKTICMNNLVDIIKNLPPIMREEIINATIKSIADIEREKIIKEIRRSAVSVVEDVTELVIESYETGRTWQRPKYTDNMDNRLYDTYVEIAEHFVISNSDKLIFNNKKRNDGYNY